VRTFTRRGAILAALVAATGQRITTAYQGPARWELKTIAVTYVGPDEYYNYVEHAARVWSAVRYAPTFTTRNGAQKKCNADQPQHGEVIVCTQQIENFAGQTTTWENERREIVSGKIIFAALNESGYSSAFQIETMVHEFGHVLGLPHDRRENSIMNSPGFRGLTTPLAHDRKRIADRYGPRDKTHRGGRRSWIGRQSLLSFPVPHPEKRARTGMVIGGHGRRRSRCYGMWQGGPLYAT